MARPRRLGPRPDLPASRLLGLSDVTVVDCRHITGEDGRLRHEIALDVIDDRPEWPARASAEKRLHDVPLMGNSTVLHVRGFRRLGPNAEKYCLFPMWVIGGGLRMTTRAAEAVILAALADTYAAVERRFGIPRRKVRVLMTAFLARFEERFRPRAARLIGLDGVHAFSLTRTMIADLEAQRVIDVLEDHTPEAITAWLQAAPSTEMTVAYAIDMSGTLRSAIRASFVGTAHPKRNPMRIVADKRHVIAMVLRDLAQERRRRLIGGQRELCTGERTRIETLARLMTKSGRELSADQTAWLETLLAETPDGRRVLAAYRQKESFLALYSLGSRQAAERAYTDWLAGLTDNDERVFRRSLTTLVRWREEFLAYFDGDRPTTGFVESANRVLKDIIRDMRGHRNFSLVRARTLFAIGRDTTKRLMRRLAAEIAVDFASKTCSGPE